MALDKRSIQLFIEITLIPEDKMFVGGVRLTQDERADKVLSVRGEPFGGVYPERSRRAQNRLVEPPS